MKNMLRHMKVKSPKTRIWTFYKTKGQASLKQKKERGRTVKEKKKKKDLRKIRAKYNIWTLLKLSWHKPMGKRVLFEKIKEICMWENMKN